MRGCDTDVSGSGVGEEVPERCCGSVAQDGDRPGYVQQDRPAAPAPYAREMAALLACGEGASVTIRFTVANQVDAAVDLMKAADS